MAIRSDNSYKGPFTSEDDEDDNDVDDVASSCKSDKDVEPMELVESPMLDVSDSALQILQLPFLVLQGSSTASLTWTAIEVWSRNTLSLPALIVFLILLKKMVSGFLLYVNFLNTT